MEHRGASVIVLVFIVASGKLLRDTMDSAREEKSIIYLKIVILKTLR
jgi:hypothetical protein